MTPSEVKTQLNICNDATEIIQQLYSNTPTQRALTDHLLSLLNSIRCIALENRGRNQADANFAEENGLDKPRET